LAIKSTIKSFLTGIVTAVIVVYFILAIIDKEKLSFPIEQSVYSILEHYVAEKHNTRYISSDLNKETDILEKIDYWEPAVRSFAIGAIAVDNGGAYSINQVCDIWDEIMSRWVYVNDPRGKIYQDNYHLTEASKTIELYNFRGDCDDFAVLVAACIHAVGGTARIRIEYDANQDAGHAYPLLFIGNDPTSVIEYLATRYSLTGGYGISFIKYGEDWWLNLDWTAVHPGGPIWAPEEYREELLDIAP
jgi:transglutaminase-like putative cysteine protease